MRLRMLSVKDKNGNEKTEFMNELRADHPEMVGTWNMQSFARNFGNFILVWDDKSSKMLMTSFVIDLKETENKVYVETQNSVYEFEKI